jgi:hypothetical protein
MRVTKTGFVCAATSCSFWTGDSLDLAAVVLGSYEQALDLAVSLSPRWLDTLSGRRWEVIRAELSDSLRALRAVTSFFTSINNEASTLLRTHTLMGCRRHLLEPESMPRSIYALTSGDTKRLYALLSKVSVQRERPGDYNHAALVFFQDLHRISKVVLLPMLNGQRVSNFTTLRLFSSRFSFFGVHDLLPGDAPVLCQQFLAAARDNSQNFASRRRAFKIGFSLDAEHSDGGEWPEAAAVSIDVDQEPLLTAVSMAQNVRSVPVLVRFKGRETSPMPWDQFISGWIVDRMVAKEGDMSHWMTWLDSACLSQALRAKVITRAAAELEPSAVLQLRDLFKNRAVLHDDKVTLFETPEGYHAQKRGGDGENQRIELANFVVELNANLIFRDTVDIFHTGTMQCGGSNFKIRITSAALDNASTFELGLRQAAIIGTPAGHDCPLPTLRDRGLARLIISWLRNQSVNLPTIHGVSRLGWDSQRKSFQSPTWLATADGVLERPCVLHPENLPAVYQELDLPKQPALEKVPAELCTLVAQLVAVIARGGLGEPQKPVFYSDSLATRQALLATFAAVGQTQVLDLAFAGQGMRQIEFMRSFPVLISGLNRSQVTRVQQPLFILGSGPLVSAEAPAGLPAFLRESIQATIAWVLSGAPGYQRAAAVLHEEQLEREGVSILQNVLGRSGWPGSSRQFPRFEEWLAGITLAQLEADAELDAQSQMVAFPLSATQVEIEIELRARANHVEVRQGRLWVDSSSACAWLETFYGQPPRLALTNLPAIPN